MTNTCWCFSTTSFFESEVYRLTASNLRILCMKCNLQKSNKIPSVPQSSFNNKFIHLIFQRSGAFDTICTINYSLNILLHLTSPEAVQLLIPHSESYGESAAADRSIRTSHPKIFLTPA